MTHSPFDRLFVLWRTPTDDGTRHVVGELSRRDRRFHFRYLPLSEPLQAAGFRPFVGFPRIDESYESGYLFSMFAERIPSPGRPDRPRMMDSWGVTNPDDVMEVLARSGGVQLTDRVELAEWRAEDDDLTRPLELRLAGIRHHDSSQVKTGDVVTLRRDPTNPADPHAVEVLSERARRVGFIPRQYAKMCSAILAGAPDALHAVVVRKLPDVDAPSGRCVLRVSRVR